MSSSVLLSPGKEQCVTVNMAITLDIAQCPKAIPLDIAQCNMAITLGIA